MALLSGSQFLPVTAQADWVPLYHEQFWIAATLGIASALMLELKATLESLSNRITPGSHKIQPNLSF